MSNISGIDVQSRDGGGVSFTNCCPIPSINNVWMSADCVLLAPNGVLNRKFTSLVDDRVEVCAGHQ
jgi:hypothetical protein